MHILNITVQVIFFSNLFSLHIHYFTFRDTSNSSLLPVGAGFLTLASDVYSFGVALLELLDSYRATEMPGRTKVSSLDYGSSWWSEQVKQHYGHQIDWPIPEETRSWCISYIAVECVNSKRKSQAFHIWSLRGTIGDG